MIQDKVQQLTNDIQNRHIHRWQVWFSLKVQFWPRIGYGLCSSTATFHKLEWALHSQYYQILPQGGVIHTTFTEIRTIDAGFFGVGLPHLGIEALITMSNKLFMHFGCKTASGKLMQLSNTLLLVKLGLSFHLLQKSFDHMDSLSHTSGKISPCSAWR